MSSKNIFFQEPRDKKTVPRYKLDIPSPGVAPTKPPTDIKTFLLPAGLTIVGLIIMIVVSSSMGSGKMLWLSMAMTLPMMLGSYIVSFLNYRSRNKEYEKEKKERKTKYEKLIADERKKLKSVCEETRKALVFNYPTPSDCYTIVKDIKPQRLWAIGPNEKDFLNIRVGTDEIPLDIEINVPEQNKLTPDPLVSKAKALAENETKVEKAPKLISLSEAGIMGVTGTRNDVLNILRTFIIQIVTHHSPQDVKLVGIYPNKEHKEWKWMRWLPHVWSDDREIRYLAKTRKNTEKILAFLKEKLDKRKLLLEKKGDYQIQKPLPNYIFLLGDISLYDGEPILRLLFKDFQELGAYSIFLSDPSSQIPKPCKVIIDLNSHKPTIRYQIDERSDEFINKLDTISVGKAEKLSRRMAPIRLKNSDQTESFPSIVPLFDLFNIGQVEELDILERWNGNDPYNTMSVPVGRIGGGKIQYIDLHEPRNKNEPNSRYGHGPNGLVAGAVGSGKGEFLYSLIISLSINFSPKYVNFVLFDFLAPGLVNDTTKSLPHVIGTSTNLDEGYQILRSLRAISAEIKRRSRIFDKESVLHIDEYMELYQDREVNEPLPYIVIIVDEWPELKDKFPVAKSLFDSLAQTGRKFGFRLILAAQKPAGEISESVQANTKFRLCLRVNRSEDSRDVIGRADAAYISTAGRGYLRLGEGQSEIYTQFQAAWSNAPYENKDKSYKAIEINQVMLNGSRKLLLGEQDDSDNQKQLNVVTNHILHQAKQMNIKPSRLFWLPPLPERLEPDMLPSPIGWDDKKWKKTSSWLSPKIGLTDNVLERKQNVLEPDLKAHGSMYICGAANENAMAVRAIIESLVQEHSPTKLHIYALDFGSARLNLYKDLPHFGAVIRGRELRRSKRLFYWLKNELKKRENLLGETGMTFDEYRQSNQTSKLAAIIVIIDNVNHFEPGTETVKTLEELVNKGSSVGIHFILTGDKTSSLHKVLPQVDSLRIALQLDNKYDYRDILKNYPENLIVPKGVKGRGLYKSDDVLVECQIMNQLDRSILNQMISDMKEAVEDTKKDSLPMPILELPKNVPFNDFLDMVNKQREVYVDKGTLQIPFALDDISLEPIGVSITNNSPHFQIISPPGGGRTSLIYTWVLMLATLVSQERVKFVLFDTTNRSLSTLKELPHVLYYAKSDPEKIKILRKLKKEFEKRRSISDDEQKRTPIVLIADDFGRLNSDSIKNALLNHAKNDTEFGFHLILAENSGTINQYNKLHKVVLAGNTGMIVGSVDIDNDASVFNRTFTTKEKQNILFPGRGYLIQGNECRLVQIASPGSKQEVENQVKHIASLSK